MKNQKLLTDAYKKSVAKKATKEVDMAVEKYEKIQPAKKDDIFTYMFEEMPQQLQEQYDEMRRR
jgi:TPP-dependent pyruvate/acetoin dehydrogenase alpha subunit